ncbi:hypothetical protein OHS81_08435 [Streptomyces sp. NBC_00400]
MLSSHPAEGFAALQEVRRAPPLRQRPQHLGDLRAAASEELVQAAEGPA